GERRGPRGAVSLPRGEETGLPAAEGSVAFWPRHASGLGCCGIHRGGDHPSDWAVRSTLPDESREKREEKERKGAGSLKRTFQADFKTPDPNGMDFRRKPWRR